MDEITLATLLRERQIAFGVAPKELIVKLTDMDIIKSYIICSHCGKYWVTYEQAIEIAKTIDDLEDWINQTQGECD